MNERQFRSELTDLLAGLMEGCGVLLMAEKWNEIRRECWKETTPYFMEVLGFRVISDWLS